MKPGIYVLFVFDLDVECKFSKKKTLQLLKKSVLGCHLGWMNRRFCIQTDHSMNYARPFRIRQSSCPTLTKSDSKPNPVPFHAHPNMTFSCARRCALDALTRALPIFCHVYAYAAIWESCSRMQPPPMLQTLKHLISIRAALQPYIDGVHIDATWRIRCYAAPQYEIRALSKFGIARHLPLLGGTLRHINTKNCSLSIVLTATDQKPQKSLKR